MLYMVYIANARYIFALYLQLSLDCNFDAPHTFSLSQTVIPARSAKGHG